MTNSTTHWRPSRRVVIIAAIVVVVYALVVLLYALSGRVESVGEDETPPAGGVTVLLRPQSVDAAGESVAMQLELDPSGELETTDTVTLDDDITVIVSPVGGSQSIEFAKGSIPATHGINVITPGAVETWPFDTYTQPELVVLAFRTVDGVAQPLCTKTFVQGYLPGWSLAVARAPGSGDGCPAATTSAATPSATTPATVIALSAARSWSTLAFGILLLGLMIVIATLVLYVAISVYRGRRKVEASFMSWMGAMLFATIPLRGFLPGSPPIGSWIDYLIVLWVFVALVTGLVIYVSAWMRWGSPSEPPRTPE